MADLFRRVGRILVRNGNTAGLWIPMRHNSSLKSGIWEVREIMGELTLHYVGQPATPNARYQGLDLQGLHAELPASGMTQEELDATG